LCELIAQEAGRIIDNSTFQVGLYHQADYIIQFMQIDGRRVPTPRHFDISEKQGIVGWIRKSHQSLLVHDFLAEKDSLPANLRTISDTPPRSAIFIPLMSGENAIGVMAAQSQEPNRFTAADLQRLTIIANQAATAITSAARYEQAKKRAEQLELVLTIAQKVNRTMELDEIFYLVVTLIHDTFNFHPVNIFSFDEKRGTAVLQASSLHDDIPGQRQIKTQRGLIGSAIRHHQTQIAIDTKHDDLYNPVTGDPLIDQGSLTTQSEMVIPLLIDDQLMGLLDVHSTAVGAFGTDERTVLETLATSIATAIHRTQQIAFQRRQSWFTNVQLQITDALNRATNLTDICHQVTHLLVMLTHAHQAAILLWQPDHNHYQGAAIAGTDNNVTSLFAQLQLDPSTWPPLTTTHDNQTHHTTQEPPPWLPLSPALVPPTPPETHLWPLIASQKMIGILLITAPPNSNNAATPQRTEFFRQISDKLALTIDNAQTHQAHQEEAWVTTALLQVAEAVNSHLQLADSLSTVIRFVPLLVGVPACISLIWDNNRHVYRAGPNYGLNLIGRELIESLEITDANFFDQGPSQQQDRSRYSTYYHLQLPRWLRVVLDVPTAYAFPLHGHGRLLGVLLVPPAIDGQRLSGRRVNLLTGIAHQATTAIINHQLYQEAQERDRLEQEIHVARQIQQSLIPNAAPAIPHLDILSYWQAARQVSGDFYDFLPFPDGRWGLIIADVADKGIPAALFMAISRTILRAVAYSRYEPAITLQRANEILCHDVTSDLFVTLFYAIWDPQTHTLTYANGGHNPPFFLQQNGDHQLLANTGAALGIFDDVTFTSQTIHLAPNDILVLYTDGVTEAINENWGQFDLSRLQQTVRQHQHQSAQQLLHAIQTAVSHHVGDTPQFDDITLVILKHLAS
ncbi:MAG TPA: SpoIIE family protein phosphatase, partial [Anaerolineae bacterium]|nr:SpoIIE family protein phosphatase [Anaerolineae bacterium]